MVFPSRFRWSDRQAANAEDIGELNAPSLPGAESLSIGGAASNTQTTSAATAGSVGQSSSLRYRAASLAWQIPTLIGVIPGIAEVLDGVSSGINAYREDQVSHKDALVSLGTFVKWFSSTLSSGPELLIADCERAHYKQSIDDLHANLQIEVQADPRRRLGVASRALAIKERLMELIVSGAQAGYLRESQSGEVNMNELNSMIPTLRGVQASDLVIGELISTQRYDGSAVDESLDDLHVHTYQATYQNSDVEVQDYCGGLDNHLTGTVAELVCYYNQRPSNPIIQNLYGGSVFRDQGGCLHARLVLSPCEGTPWAEFAQAKQSVEVMCQIAEKITIMFRQLKQLKQIKPVKFKDIRVRTDGTLLLIPHTQGDNFLNHEHVFTPYTDPEVQYETGWPFAQICLLLRESITQSLVNDAVHSLRKRDKTGEAWDEIAVWRIAEDIELGPVPRTKSFYGYPPLDWTTEPGSIMRLEERGDMEFVGRLPRHAMKEREIEQRSSFFITNATGGRGHQSNYYTYPNPGGPFSPTQYADWECFPLEHWHGVDQIELNYESVQLGALGWKVWERILRGAARIYNEHQEQLGIVSKLGITMKICKADVPELGTRPIYFYRRKLGADTRSQQFWGFFTFNQNPLGPTGLTIRHGGSNGCSRIVSESLPPDPPGYEPKMMIHIEIGSVNKRDDWDVKIAEREHHIRQRMMPVASTYSTAGPSNQYMDAN